MEADHATEILVKIASGEAVNEGSWPELRPLLLARLDKIAHNDFPIPRLSRPLPPPITTTTTTTTTTTNTNTNTSTTTTTTSKNASESGRRSSLPLSSPTTEHPLPQEANKEDAPTEEPRDAAPRELPTQINDMLLDIKEHLETFKNYPPHTIQRLAELLLRPKAHYRALASYLHAVDRVVRVSSATNTYPLPPAIFDLSKLGLNGEDSRDGDAAAHVAWSNPTVAALGTDEALGGALLTPIPWLTRRSPEGSTDGEGEGEGDGDGETTSTPMSTSTMTTPAAGGAQIHSEATETIDGPNGVGSIETVSVSVNGVPSTGHHTRGITQGELLRQEQRAGVVPVSQLARAQESSSAEGDAQGPPPQGQPEEAGQERDQHQQQEPHEQQQDQQDPEPQEQKQQQQNQDSHACQTDEDEVPHARGPEEIGIEDTGPQASTRSYMSEDGSFSMQGIDVDAALGRKHDDTKQQGGNSSPAVGDDTQQSVSTGPAVGDDKTQQSVESGPAVVDDTHQQTVLSSPAVTDDTKAEKEQDGPHDNDDDNASRTSSTDSAGTKREAEAELEGDHAKKMKQDGVESASGTDTTSPAGQGDDKAGSCDVKEERG
ncbi:hypothetical protein E4U55_005467 [Claviceps digitariae]|nr:hypothetical protein E4U55_005467 [Claviceps digitariae]